MVVSQAWNQDFSAQSRLLGITPLRETFQRQQTNKRPHGEKLRGFFHLASPKTALLMRNLPLDPCKLGILPNTWGHYFQFPIKSRGDLHSSNRRKTNFVNELMEV